jgi:hypothetical protein
LRWNPFSWGKVINLTSISLSSLCTTYFCVQVKQKTHKFTPLVQSLLHLSCMNLGIESQWKESAWFMIYLFYVFSLSIPGPPCCPISWFNIFVVTWSMILSWCRGQNINKTMVCRSGKIFNTECFIQDHCKNSVHIRLKEVMKEVSVMYLSFQEERF